MSYRLLRIDRDEAVAVLTIERPEKLNALNTELIGELGAALEELESDADVRGIIVTGAGDKAFVAGADIGELREMTHLTGVATARRGQAVFRRMERMPKPVIAAVNGFALGGGLELALSAHLRIASDNARFGLPEVKLGIIPGYGGTIRLPRLIGRARALEMILTGDMIDAPEAHRIGLVNRVVEPARLAEETRGLLERILANGPVAVAMALEAVDRNLTADTDSGLAFEAHLFGRLAATEDMREGMDAFLEKRRAQFRGR